MRQTVLPMAADDRHRAPVHFDRATDDAMQPSSDVSLGERHFGLAPTTAIPWRHPENLGQLLSLKVAQEFAKLVWH